MEAERMPPEIQKFHEFLVKTFRAHGLPLTILRRPNGIALDGDIDQLYARMDNAERDTFVECVEAVRPLVNISGFTRSLVDQAIKDREVRREEARYEAENSAPWEVLTEETASPALKFARFLKNTGRLQG